MPVRNGNKGFFEVKKWFLGFMGSITLLLLVPGITFISNIGGAKETVSQLCEYTKSNQERLETVEAFKVKCETKMEAYDNLFEGIDAGFKEQQKTWQKLDNFMARQDERLKAIEGKLK